MERKIIALIMTVSMVFGGVLGIFTLLDLQNEHNTNIDDHTGEATYSNLKKFGSYDEIQDFLAGQAELSGGGYAQNITGNQYYVDKTFRLVADTAAEGDYSGGSNDYSKTNVQVEGVDEGDIVKTDGEYAYVVSRNQTKVYMIKVFPAEDARIVSTLEFEWTVRELYVSSEKLVVLGTNIYYYAFSGFWMPEEDIRDHSYEPSTHLNVYDITDRENPVLTREHVFEGSYVDSRMIDNYLYLIVNQYTTQVESEDDLPVPSNQVYFANEYDYWYTFTTIISVNVQSPQEEPNMQTILLGVSTHIYVSTQNIYLGYTKRESWVEQTERKIDEVIIPMMPAEIGEEVVQLRNSEGSRLDKLSQIDAVVGEYTDSLSESQKADFYQNVEVENNKLIERIAPDMVKTMIHRIRIDNGKIQYEASGGVVGYVLNRFSMDEYNGYFRIATTSGDRWWWGSQGNTLSNQVFVCSMDLKIVGGIRDIAPGESIFSARFAGDVGYLVTFKNIDPFFVIDLSEPTNPKAIGELKIPGYSNYLHPLDDDHVIGLGKDAIDAGDFAWYQGVKLSLFDVSDLQNPKEKDNFVIGDRGTDSLALTDPHAFLASKSKGLLVIPILLAEINESNYPDEIPDWAYGEYTWCGAYVFSFDEESGFELLGGITHVDEGPSQEKPGYFDFWGKNIKRSFYIEDTLYTLSDYMLKANSLADLSEISSVALED